MMEVFLYIYFMKKAYFLVSLVLILCGCSSDSTETPIVPPVAVDPPVAVNDQINAIEDQDTIISGVLTNDQNIGASRITSIDATTAQNGTVVDNRDGTYTYQPVDGFTGVDTFAYTVCDKETTPNCSTATVEITVTDEGTPVASNDTVLIVQNTSVLISNLLENDELIDDSELTAINTTATLGTAELNANGSISYTAPNGFTGEDTIEYSLCDDDAVASCVTGIITISVLEGTSFNVPSELTYYYGDLQFTDNAEVNYTLLKDHTVTNHTTILSYSQRHSHLYNADADESNSDNVILMYSGESRYWKEYTSGSNPYSTQTYNTEHIYPQSKLVSEDAVTDLHHLRSCDAIVNEDRSNFSYTVGSGTYSLSNEKWYPGDDWRGDVARMVMYVNIRYQESFEKVGNLNLFLEWNVLDPVSTFEQQRNMFIEGAQGNRNPFIDNPYLATLLWGGSPAINTWE